MSKSSVTCPSGHRVVVDEQAAGSQVSCPVCSTRIDVPATAETMEIASPPDLMATQSFVAASPSAPIRAATMSRATSTRRIWLVFGVGATTISLAAIIAIVALQNRNDEPPAASNPDSRSTVQAETSSEAEDELPELAGFGGRLKLPNPRKRPSARLLAEAPFDVKFLFERVDPSANAASLYLEALSEINTEMIGCFPQNEREAVRQRVAPISKRLDDAHRVWLSDRSQVSTDELDAVISLLEPVVEKLREAQQRPDCDFQADYGMFTLLPYVQAARTVARLLALRIGRFVERGDIDAAIADLRVGFRLSRDLCTKSFAVSLLVAVAIDGVMLDSQRLILASPRVTVEHCDTLARMLLEELDDKKRLDSVLAAEYVAMRLALDDIERATGGDISDEFRSLLGLPANADRTTVAARIFVSSSRDTSNAAKSDLERRVEAHLELMTADDFQRDAQLLGQAMSRQREIVRRPFREIAAADRELRASISKESFLVARMLPEIASLSVATTRNLTMVRGGLCLVALRRWQLTHPGEPADFSAMLVDAGITTVPIDPFSDEPFKMTRLNSRPVIYSVGPDLHDDQALIRYPSDQARGDMLFELP